MSDEPTVVLDRETIAAQLEDLKAHHSRVVEQRNRDWDALMVLIATAVGTEEERECAEMEEMEEFDPWHALRRHIAASPTIASDYRDIIGILNQHAVPVLTAAGKPATLAERVRMLAESREEARNLAEERLMAWAVLARLQPLRAILRSWDWRALLADERIPDEAVLPILRAMATVEAAENEAAKAKEVSNG